MDDAAGCLKDQPSEKPRELGASGDRVCPPEQFLLINEARAFHREQLLRRWRRSLARIRDLLPCHSLVRLPADAASSMTIAEETTSTSDVIALASRA